MIATATQLLSAEEFVRDYSDRRAELVRGMVVEIPMPGTQHGAVCFNVALELGIWVKAHGQGRFASNDTYVQTRRGPDTLRGADICYWSNDRQPPCPLPEGLAEQQPDLVVEVKSPSDRWPRILAKVTEYLDAGVRVVIVLDPPTGSATVYRTDEIQQVLDNGDTLTLPDVLPGFAVPVRKLFE